MIYRIAARGILECDDKILFIEYRDTAGIFYALPGGEQLPGESLGASLIREYKEETDLDIDPLEIVLINEFIDKNSTVELWKDGIHQVEIIFRCKLKDSNQNHTIGTKPDNDMLGLKWIHKSEFKHFRIYPSDNFDKFLEDKKLCYSFTER
jgi:ADP-ribose pyrophosphatase YjhB (NUDIX family)